MYGYKTSIKITTNKIDPIDKKNLLYLMNILKNNNKNKNEIKINTKILKYHEIIKEKREDTKKNNAIISFLNLIK